MVMMLLQTAGTTTESERESAHQMAMMLVQTAGTTTESEPQMAMMLVQTAVESVRPSALRRTVEYRLDSLKVRMWGLQFVRRRERLSSE